MSEIAHDDLVIWQFTNHPKETKIQETENIAELPHCKSLTLLFRGNNSFFSSVGASSSLARLIVFIHC